MKIKKLSLSKSCTVQVSDFEPVNSFYSLEVELDKGDDLEKVKEELNNTLTNWCNFEILSWKSPNRAITAGKKLGMFKSKKI